MLLDRKSLSLQLAMEASQAALDRARELGIRVSIAVCDAGGHLIHLAHMDGVPAHTREIAIDKAYTSACFGFPPASGPRAWTACRGWFWRGWPAGRG